PPCGWGLGNHPADAVRRIVLKPLSEGAVRLLASRTGRSAMQLHAQTGGNPFYVTELLASPQDSVPASVREAALARAMRLSPEARALLDLCSVVPTRIERRLIGEEASAGVLIDECVSTGLLIDEGEVLRFRHELARQAIESALPRSSVRELHGTVLRRLLARNTNNVATLVHHAAAPGD